MKSKWYSVFCFLFLAAFVFLIMYWVQTHGKELKMEDLEKIVEKEMVEFHKNK